MKILSNKQFDELRDDIRNELESKYKIEIEFLHEEYVDTIKELWKIILKDKSGVDKKNCKHRWLYLHSMPNRNIYHDYICRINIFMCKECGKRMSQQ